MHTVVSLRFSLFFSLLGFTLCLGAGLPMGAQANTLSALHSFASAEACQAGMIQGQDGAFYGTTETGGAKGVGGVFTMNADGSGYRYLHSFGATDSSGNPDGARPVAALLQTSDGMLYGTTQAGGANGSGTVFRIKTDGTSETVTHAFSAPNGNGINTDGASPSAALAQDNNGTLYGTTWHGGSGGNGVVFKLTTSGTGFTVIHTFSATAGNGTNPDGAQPTGALILGATGNLSASGFFGTTSAGGSSGSGVIFKVNLDGSNYQVVHLFSALDTNGHNADGASPHGGLLNRYSDGLNFYGATPWGGANGTGTVFYLDNSGRFVVLHSFQATDSSGANSDGAHPYASLAFEARQNIGELIYGTTSEGGTGSAGTVFKITDINYSTGSSSFGVIYSFSGRSDFANSGTSDGAAPNTGLIKASDGSFYGTTSQEGANGTGTIYKITPGLVHVLWTNTDGTLSLWTMDPVGNFSHHEYGPYPGWTAKAIADGSDGKTRVLWDNVDGRIALWYVDNSSGQVSSGIYGPYAGWTANAVSVGIGGATHILWNNTDGRLSIWNYIASNVSSSFTQNTYGPYSGWTAKAIADGPEGKMRVLWDNANGQMSLWNLDNTTGLPTHREFGPYAGWTANAVSVGLDGTTHILWNNTDGRMSVWNHNTTNGSFTQNTYGPYSYGPLSGWTAKAIADGEDGKTRVLWDNADGQMSLWNLDNIAGTFTQNSFGSYSGWTATGVSAGSGTGFTNLQSHIRPQISRPAGTAYPNTPLTVPHRFIPHHIRVKGGNTFGDWGEFALGGATHMSMPDSIAVVPLAQPGNPMTYLQALCITDSTDTNGASLGVTDLAFFKQGAIYSSYGLTSYPILPMPIAADFLGNLYLNVPSGILIQHQDAFTTSPTLFTPVPVGMVPTGGPVSALTVDNTHQVFFAVGGQVYRASAQTPDPPTNLHLEGLSGISSLATGPGNSLYAISGGQINKFVNVGGRYFPDISFITSNGTYSPTRIAVDNSAAGSGDIFVTDKNYSSVSQLDSNGNFLAYLSSNPPLSYNGTTYFSANGDILHPLGVTVDSTGTVWVVENGQPPVGVGGFGIESGGYDNRIVPFAP